MKTSLATLFILVALSVSSTAQITPVTEFIGDGVEGFETQPTQNGVQCVTPRIFANRGDLCSSSGATVGVAGGFGGSGTIFAHSGAHCAASGTTSSVFTFDTPVQAFGGWFGTVANTSNGVAKFYDVNNALIGTQTITAFSCTLNCGWRWNGWDAGSGPRIKRIEVGTGAGSGGGLAFDELVAQFGSGPTGGFFCGADLTGTACPCSNDSNSPSRGCGNSTFAGARLIAGGTPTLGNDTVVLYAENMSNFGSALYFQGTARANGGAGIVFGDGLRCAGGSIARLGVKTSVDGTSHYPSAGDPLVHIQGQVGAPGIRTYQVWYRDPANYCTAAAFNLTNGFEIQWVP